MSHGTGKTETAGHTCDKGCVSLPRCHLNEHRDSTEKVKLCFLEKKNTTSEFGKPLSFLGSVEDVNIFYLQITH